MRACAYALTFLSNRGLWHHYTLTKHGAHYRQGTFFWSSHSLYIMLKSCLFYFCQMGTSRCECVNMRTQQCLCRLEQEFHNWPIHTLFTHSSIVWMPRGGFEAVERLFDSLLTQGTTLFHHGLILFVSQFTVSMLMEVQASFKLHITL